MGNVYMQNDGVCVLSFHVGARWIMGFEGKYVKCAKTRRKIIIEVGRSYIYDVRKLVFRLICEIFNVYYRISVNAVLSKSTWRLHRNKALRAFSLYLTYFRLFNFDFIIILLTSNFNEFLRYIFYKIYQNCEI